MMLRTVPILLVLCFVPFLSGAAQAQETDILFVLGDDGEIHRITNEGISHAITRMYYNSHLDDDLQIALAGVFCTAAEAAGDLPIVDFSDLAGTDSYLAVVVDPDTDLPLLMLVPVVLPRGWRLSGVGGIRVR